MESNDAPEEAVQYLDDAIIAAREAGTVILDGLDKQLKVDFKGRIDLVTEVDVAAQDAILGSLQGKYPGHTMWAEEDETKNPVDDDFVWLIDPLDGTTNYAHGYRCFSVSIALMVRGRLTVGVVYDPWGDELFTAIRGKGAYLNGTRLQVSGEDRLERALLVTGFPYDIRESRQNNVHLFSHLIMKAQAVRRDGSAALDLAYLAAGRFDGFWELKLHPWDMAAGALLVEEAGGTLSTFNGGDFHVTMFDLLATNGRIHRAMIDEIANVPREEW